RPMPPRLRSRRGILACWSCSEKKLQSELNVPRRRRRGDPSKGAGVQRRVRVAKVGMVEHVEELGAELQRRPFPNLHRFEDGEIEILAAGPCEHVSAQIPVVA